jgi:hypothetical protein
MASRNKGAQQKSGHKAIGFISQIFFVFHVSYGKNDVLPNRLL